MNSFEQDAAEVKSMLRQMMPLLERIDRVLTEKLAIIRAEEAAQSRVAGQTSDQVGNSHST